MEDYDEKYKWKILCTNSYRGSYYNAGIQVIDISIKNLFHLKKTDSILFQSEESYNEKYFVNLELL